MQVAEDLFGERTAHARHPGEVLDARRLYSLQSSEVREDRLPLLDADARDLLQRRGGPRFCATRAVSLYRKSVRLVANLLQQMKARMIRREIEHAIAIRKHDVLFAGLA